MGSEIEEDVDGMGSEMEEDVDSSRMWRQNVADLLLQGLLARQPLHAWEVLRVATLLGPGRMGGWEEGREAAREGGW